ncbi:hypothetical protein D8674_027184 [Pyrus ussuriensis x Pyrus communis]|uniref:Uncharacterized protein n=1 Tax=Pyrus ussuriensis x Pyrus communis TaxID=2448454 RepID=A0A5N5IGA2_9ROSA|nr:hypothetical protein D8674_027184 [Pyrus ussuriensis x Pyrus communis]
MIPTKFENHVEWGIDLAYEHERYLTGEKFKQPVIVYNYPKKTKAFYSLNEDGETVFAMDVVVPKVRHFPLKGWIVDRWKPKGRALRCSKGKDSGDGTAR